MVALFEAHFPLPPASIFETAELPDSVKAKEEAYARFSDNLKHDDNFEKKILILQREYRRQSREKKEQRRIEDRYFTPTQGYQCAIHPAFKSLGIDSAKRMMKEANTPYKPRCNKPLADRIMRCSEKVSLHSRIRHMTSRYAINNIFQHSLIQSRQYIGTTYTKNFRAGALSPADIDNGDANAICFGFEDIDPAVPRDYEFELDLKAVIAQNPMASCKVRDLCNFDQFFQEIFVNGVKFSFKCVFKTPAYQEAQFVFLFSSDQLQVENYAISVMPRELLISSNLEKLNQIIILNFFRIIDTLCFTCYGGTIPAIREIQYFYEQLESLNNEELTAFLEDVGRKISKTGEFNFYGSYKIDFDTLVSLGSPNHEYSIDMADLIAAFNEENFAVITKAFDNIPDILLNTRFITYLKSKVTSAKVLLLFSTLEKMFLCSEQELQNDSIEDSPEYKTLLAILGAEKKSSIPTEHKSDEEEVTSVQLPEVNSKADTETPSIGEATATSKTAVNTTFPQNQESEVPASNPDSKPEVVATAEELLDLNPREEDRTTTSPTAVNTTSPQNQESEEPAAQSTASNKSPSKMKHSLTWAGSTFAVTAAASAAVFAPLGLYVAAFSQFLGSFPGGAGGFAAILATVVVVASCVAGAVASRKGSGKKRSRCFVPKANSTNDSGPNSTDDFGLHAN